MQKINKEELWSRVDLTLLSPVSTENQIEKLCVRALELKTASVCVPPCFVSLAKSIVGNRTKVCTVIGFPNGYTTTAAKLAEAETALADGADELDTVVNLCWVKDRKDDLITGELKEMKRLCGERVLKVIIETCLLTEEEKILLCRLVSVSGADYIKTSTGFSVSGAAAEDIALMRRHCNAGLKIKASGGIRSFDSAMLMLENGADRIGTIGLNDK